MSEQAKPIDDETREQIRHCMEHASPRPWTVGCYYPKTREEALEWMVSMHDAGEKGLEFWNVAVPGAEVNEDMTEEQRIKSIQEDCLATAITGNGEHSDANAWLIALTVNNVDGYEALLASLQAQVKHRQESIDSALEHLWAAYITLRDGHGADARARALGLVKDAIFAFGDKVEDF